MLIRVRDYALLNDLCVHFRRSGFEVESIGDCMIEVGRPDAPDESQELREVLIHLRVWQVINPGGRIEIA
jgi:hypothetical protein